MNDQLKHEVETLIDNYGLEGVLAAMSEVCGDKAEHLRHMWQDDKAGTAWRRCGRICNTAASRVIVRATSPAR